MRTKSNERKGFTLAEVLITLGIVGIVAAMTMPTLITKHREKATVAKLKKSYSILNQAYLRAINEHGEFKDWGFPGASAGSIVDPETGERKYGDQTIQNSQIFLDIMTEHMSGVKKCYQPSCDISYYDIKTLSGGERIKGMAFNIVDLPDGTSLLGGYIISTTCEPTTLCGDFGVDINGSKNSPNTVGIDIFYFQVNSTNISPYGLSTDIFYDFPRFCDDVTDTSLNNGYACTAWVIYNENMDYLHCDDLSWDGKHKCK